MIHFIYAFIIAKWRESRHYSSDSDTRRAPDDRKIFIKRTTSKTRNGRDTRRITPGPEEASSRRNAFSRSSTLDTAIMVKGYNKAARIDKVVKFRPDQTNNIDTRRSTEHKAQNTAASFEK